MELWQIFLEMSCHEPASQPTPINSVDVLSAEYDLNDSISFVDPHEPGMQDESECPLPNEVLLPFVNHWLLQLVIIICTIK